MGAWFITHKKTIIASLITAATTLLLSGIIAMFSLGVAIARSPADIIGLKSEVNQIKCEFVTKEQFNAYKDRVSDKLIDIIEDQEEIKQDQKENRKLLIKILEKL